MQMFNANQYLPPDPAEWHFLVELSLNEFFIELDRSAGLAAGRLYQTVRQLGMPAERVENMEMILAGFAKEAPVYFNEGRLELTGRIRVFCQKKILEAGPELSGGWGYFVIERGGKDSAGPLENCWNSVDLYLYKEGE
jgi:hypothetical protein